ncbi:DUF1289 domain-containing protein [Limnohabitans sp. B9-3]|uniref:DUF1289 domain-containing protein n=1 Tax=Limnohabitans sp. B9-3 TaxID=1100707 RepID=UPI000C1EDABC|nr:DUF1289 domain-containing protein [Limnohabitans sp. B9-3]PIT78984.1 hypothetical protein B9Z42_02585 [Limnohabitans sp. B9-3]
MCGSELTPKPQGPSAVALNLLAYAQKVLRDAGPVPSPCISVCRMSDDTQVCEGCWRTLDEIGAWGQSSEANRRGVWGRIAARISSMVAP